MHSRPNQAGARRQKVRQCKARMKKTGRRQQPGGGPLFAGAHESAGARLAQVAHHVGGHHPLVKLLGGQKAAGNGRFAQAGAFLVRFFGNEGGLVVANVRVQRRHLSAGLGACTVNLDRGGLTDSQGSAGASSHSAADPSQEPSEDSDGDMPTPSDSPTALPPLTDQGGTAFPDPERPGAGATITSKEWVRAQQSRDKKTMTPDNGQVVVDRSFATVVKIGRAHV